MDLEYAKELLQVLADGVNPLTGEVLPEGDSCNQVQIVRALNSVLRELERQAGKTKKHLPECAGKPWTEENDKLLISMFDSGETRKTMCAYFKRTPGAITSRLVRLGKIR